MDRQPGLSIGHRPRPGTVPLILRHLAGDVGDHRTKARQLPGGLGEPRKGLEVNPELDRASPSGGSGTSFLAQQQLQQEIGPELVHGPFLSLLLQPSGQPGQSPVGGLGPVGGKVMALEGGGPELVSRHRDIAVLDRLPVAEPGILGIGQITEPLGPDPDLGGGETRGLGEHLL